MVSPLHIMPINQHKLLTNQSKWTFKVHNFLTFLVEFLSNQYQITFEKNFQDNLFTLVEKIFSIYMLLFFFYRLTFVVILDVARRIILAQHKLLVNCSKHWYNIYRYSYVYIRSYPSFGNYILFLRCLVFILV